MALLTCLECGRAVSEMAAVCPGCGLPAGPRMQFPVPYAPPAPPLTRDQLQRRRARVFLSVAVGTAMLIVVAALIVKSDADASAARHVETQKLVDELAARTAASAAAEQRGIDQQKIVTDKARARSAAMDRANRDHWIDSCVQRLRCPQSQLDAMIEGAPEGPERDRADRVLDASEVQFTAKTDGRDGAIVSDAAREVASKIAGTNDGLALFDFVPKTTLAEARKTPDSARGAAIKAAGSIVEIHSQGRYTDGALMTGDGVIVRFLTKMATTNIYAQSWASFTGVFIQQFSYPNVSGGETQTLLLAGAFDLPENHTVTNPPAPILPQAAPRPFAAPKPKSSSDYDPALGY